MAPRSCCATSPIPMLETLTAAGLIGAVRDVSIEVTAGEIFIIMGLSGSGKSTLVRCLSRLVEPTAGEVNFEGRDLLRAGEKELIEIRRHKMGMVFQHFALLPHLYVLDNIAFPLSVQGVTGRAREARAARSSSSSACAAAKGISRASSPAASSSASASPAAWRSGPRSGSSTSRSRRWIR